MHFRNIDKCVRFSWSVNALL